MRIRSLMLSSFAAAAWCLAPSAHADVPGPTGAGGADAGEGTGGAGGGGDPSCTISAEEQSGTTCVACDTTIGLCSEQLGSSYNYVCKSGTTTEVWCDGPARNQVNDTNVACAVKVPGAAYGDLLGVAVVAAAALAIGARRRRRG